MARNSSTFNFKQLPLALLLAVVITAGLELFVSVHAWKLADWNTLAIVHKKQMLKQRQGSDVVFFGDSLLWALDAKKMQDKLSAGMTAYNYYIANLGPGFNLSLVFKQYLEHKSAPRVALVSWKPSYFYAAEGLEFKRDYQVVQFRRYIEPLLLVRNLPFKPGLKNFGYNFRLCVKFAGVLKEYLIHFLPSYDYRVLLRKAGPPFLLPDDRSGELWTLERQLDQWRSNQKVLEYMDEHQGQLRMLNDEAVSEDGVTHEIPERAPAEVTNFDLERILEMAQSAEIPVLYFWMPVWDERYTALGGDAYMEPIQTYLDNLTKRYPNFRVMASRPALYSRENFMDPAHLNLSGYAKFNQEFADEFAIFMRKYLSDRFEDRLLSRGVS